MNPGYAVDSTAELVKSSDVKNMGKT